MYFTRKVKMFENRSFA